MFRASVFFFVTLHALAALAQSGPARLVLDGELNSSKIEIPDGITIDEVNSFIAPLTDDQTRRLLLETLAERATVATPAEAMKGERLTFSDLLDRIRAGSSRAAENMAALSEALPRTGEIIDHAFTLVTDLQGWPRMWAGIGNLALMIVVGLVAAILTGRFLTGVVDTQIVAFQPANRRDKALALMLRLGSQIGQLIAFVIAGHVTSLLFFDRFDPMRIFLISWFGVVATGGAAYLIARLLFAPAMPHLRIPKMSDHTAAQMAWWLFSTVTVAAFFALNSGMLALLAVPPVMISLWQIAGGLLIVFLTLTTVLRTAPAQGEPLQARGTGFITLVARSLAPKRTALLATGIVLLFVIWAGRTFASEHRDAAAALLAGLAFAAAWYTSRIGSDSDPIGPEADGSAAAGNPFPVFSVVFAAIGGIALIQALVVDLVALTETPTGQKVAAVLLKAGITFVIAALAWTILSRTISRFIEREHEKAKAEMGDAPEDSEGGSGIISSRLATLLPIFRGFALAVLVIITFMIVLSSIGIDIGPLLAGAGVIGIALGFGAQALVKDILSGIFFLIDDAFRVGEYIEFAEYRGEVERISIRSMRLRHHLGPVQTIPFGELLVVTNHNRDWIIYKQEFQVPYEVDIEKIRKIVKRIGLELLEDPVHGPNFLAPLKSQGVRRVENGVLVIGTKFMCKPREQFVLRRVVYQRVRDELYKNGIALAHRRVQIELPGPAENVSDDVKRRAVAAAEIALEDEAEASKSVR
ncbi:MAG: mechanosensitive ion channel family protein [Geminicoccaceae bacterium]